jgi:hypothetical protein
MPLPISVHYGKADRGPDFIIEVTERDGTVRDITTATSPKFYLYDLVNGTLLVNGSTDGVSIVPTNQIKRIIQPSDTASEIENAVAWFTYTLAAKEESTYAVGFIVSERWKRVMI